MVVLCQRRFAQIDLGRSLLRRCIHLEDTGRDTQSMTNGRKRTILSNVWIGTSGWTYDGWRGSFYPRDVAKKRWLIWYATQFSATEINGSFYRTPSLERVRRWRDSTPETSVCLEGVEVHHALEASRQGQPEFAQVDGFEIDGEQAVNSARSCSNHLLTSKLMPTSCELSYLRDKARREARGKTPTSGLGTWEVLS
jgi:hypothetical protein